MTDGTFMWWPRFKPVPEGWEYAGDGPRVHHEFWSVLLRRIDGGTDGNTEHLAS